MMKTRKVALTAILTALCIGTNYAMLNVPNVKFMDFIVFVGGFSLGPILGGLVGALSWVVYGTLNPGGFSFIVWIATMFSETIYGIAGGMISKLYKSPKLEHKEDGVVSLSVFFSVTAVFLTLTYDIITTIAFWLSIDPAARSQTTFLTVFIFGIPFLVLHIVSNAVFFGVGSVPVIKILSKMISGGERIGNVKK